LVKLYADPSGEIMDISTKIAEYFPILLGGIGYTIGVTAVTFCCSTIIGLTLGVAAFQMANPRAIGQPGISIWFRYAALFAINAYVRVFKGLPALTLLFSIYFAFPQIGLKLSSFTSAVLGLTMIGSALLSEVFRSGLASIHRGQSEAALAAGLTPLGTLFAVLLPQTWRVTLPPLANYAIGLLKDTSIVAAIAAPEVMFYARNLVTRTFDTGLVYALVAAIYFALSFPLARAADALERSASRGRR
jgi:His/Glu/Gln/Arg/opine family amino acid ABC transporter permease subunit